MSPGRVIPSTRGCGVNVKRRNDELSRQVREAAVQSILAQRIAQPTKVYGKAWTAGWPVHRGVLRGDYQRYGGRQAL